MKRPVEKGHQREKLFYQARVPTDEFTGLRPNTLPSESPGMTMTMKRLSMTGLVEDCAADQVKDDTVASRHSHDKTVSEDGSQTSATLDLEKIPCEENAAKPASSRRRRSLFGSSSGAREDSVERANFDRPQKPASRRRRSLFGSSTSDLDTEATTQKPSSRRRSFFGSSAKPDATMEIDDPSERSESTTSSRPVAAARRRSLFGTSTPTLDETIGCTPPRPNKGSGQSVASESSHSTRKSLNSADTPPRDRRRGMDRAKSMDSPSKKKKDKVKRGNGLTGAWSFTDSNSRDRRTTITGSTEKTSINDVPPSPSTPKRTPRSFRRMSLSALIGAGGDSSHDSDVEQTPKKPQSSRRASLTGGSPSEDSGPSRRANRRSSTGGSSSPASSSTTSQALANPYDLVNKARAKKGLAEFSRNMLMDTLAKQVAMDLAASSGTKCTPTSYYGNIGQGESVENIHKTMMKQKEGVARSHILATHFYEIGIGISRSKDGMIYMCQLFK